MRNANPITRVIMLSTMLGAAFGTLEGCMTGPEEAAGESAAVSSHVEYLQGPDQKTLGLVKDGELDSYLHDMASFDPSTTPLRGGSREDADSNVSYDANDDARSCWVTLDWCSEPGTGYVVCHQNGGCTRERFIQVCWSLYNDICT